MKHGHRFTVDEFSFSPCSSNENNFRVSKTKFMQIVFFRLIDFFRSIHFTLRSLIDKQLTYFYREHLSFFSQDQKNQHNILVNNTEFSRSKREFLVSHPFPSFFFWSLVFIFVFFFFHSIVQIISTDLHFSSNFFR